MKLADIKTAASAAESKPQAGLNDQVIMIYGEKSVGKSTEASRFDRPLFFDFEDRLRNILLPDGTRPGQLQFDDWATVLDVTKQLKTTTPEKFGYRTLVIDGCNFAFVLMLRQLFAEYEVESWNEGELGYMKGRDKAVKRWGDWMHDLRALTRQGFCIVFTAHETQTEFEHNNQKVNKRVPLVSGVSGGIDHGWQVMRPAIDMVIHVAKKEVDGKPMVTMRLKGTPLIEAADPTPDARLPAEMRFSHKLLQKAWDTPIAKPSRAAASKAKTQPNNEGAKD